MAITKMKMVVVSGPIDRFDSVAEKYIYGRDIHLENAMSVLTGIKRLRAFDEASEYDAVVKSAENIFRLTGGIPQDSETECKEQTADEMLKFIDEINSHIENEKKEAASLSAEIESNNDAIKTLGLMNGLNVDMAKINNMEFVKYRFGHIPKASYKTLMTYLDDLETVFIKTAEDQTDIWGFYFTPRLKKSKIDDVFTSLYFEEIPLDRTYSGAPDEIKRMLTNRNEALKGQITELSKKTAGIIADSKTELIGIYNLAKKRKQFSEIRRCAAHGEMFFYIVGWMEAKDAAKLEKEIGKSGDVVIFNQEDAEDVKNITPPTKLKNNPICKPFEMFVKMYGLPNYREIDPTPILAFTYILFFGIMFGDVGQSAVLAIVGFLAYKFKKMDLGGIIGMVGLAGIVSGFIYGSVFGNEEILPELFHYTPMQPMENIMSLLIGTVCMGGIVIIFGMVLNVINMLKSGNKGEAFFGHNGLAGILFYVAVVLLAANILLNLGIPTVVFVVMLIIAVLVMYLSEPLTRLIEGEKNLFPTGGMFFVESFFELFEVILSFCTNTISFLRIGAFAVIHVGMMMAVASLSAGGGVGGMLVTVFGNILVMVLEGLIVAIQVLRLEYYEMFSRYYSGHGREFVSLKNK